MVEILHTKLSFGHFVARACTNAVVCILAIEFLGNSLKPNKLNKTKFH